MIEKNKKATEGKKMNKKEIKDQIDTLDGEICSLIDASDDAGSSGDYEGCQEMMAEIEELKAQVSHLMNEYDKAPEAPVSKSIAQAKKPAQLTIITGLVKIHETPKAVLFKVNRDVTPDGESVLGKCWIPKSMIHDIVDRGQSVYGSDVTIPVWFAKKITVLPWE